MDLIGLLLVPMRIRTDAEILARIEDPAGKQRSFFGSEREELIVTLEFASAVPYIKEGLKESEWQPLARDYDGVIERIKTYMTFAVEKVEDHRGLSAGRSIEHMHGLVWLLGDYDYNEIDWEAYAQYGAPVLQKIITHLRLDIETTEGFKRMAVGEKCTPECENGCG
jgi:hypothetical protein